MKNTLIVLCWACIFLCIASILIVITNGGIYLFKIGENIHVVINDTRRPTGLLILFSAILLLLKKTGIKEAIYYLENICTEKFTILVLTFFSLLFIRIKIGQHMAFWTGAYDLSMFDYAVFNTAKGKFMFTPMLERNFFSEHFSPLLLFFVPIYFIYASPVILLIAQAIATACGGYFIYKLSRSELKNNLISFLLMLAYLGSTYLVNSFMFDFHIEIFEPLMILGAFYYFRTGKIRLYWIFILLALMCKEDMAIYIFVLGLYFVFLEKNKKASILTCGASLFWAFLAWKIFIPMCYTDGRNISHFLLRWSKYGQNYTEIILNIVKNPLELIKCLFSQHVLKLFASVLFIPLLAPLQLALTIPPLLLNLTSNFKMQSHLLIHYTLPIIPFLWIAFIFGLKKIKNKNLLLVISFAIYVINFGDYYFYKIDNQSLEGHAVCNLIPDKVPVSVQSCFVPHLSYRDDVWIFPTIKNAEYILVYLNRPCLPSNDKRAYIKTIKRIQNNNNWTIIYDSNGYILFKKRSPHPSLSQA